MLAELRTKSQITLPKDIVLSLGLSEGDKLEVYEKDGVMYVSKSKLMEIISQNQSCAEIYRYLRKQNGDITLDALIEGSDYNQGASVRYLPELDSVIIG